MIGNIVCPQLLWAMDLGDQSALIPIRPIEGSITISLPGQGTEGNRTRALQNHFVNGESIALPGTNSQKLDESGNGVVKIGSWLTNIDGYQRITCDPGIQSEIVEVNGAYGCQLDRWTGSNWARVWQSETLPEFRSGAQGNGRPIVADIDNDGELEVAVSAWFEIYVLDLATGKLEHTATFTKKSENLSGRAYGWFGAFNLDSDPKLELVLLADFLPHIQVVGWNARNELVELWDRIIEPTILMNDKIHEVSSNAVADIDGDGIPEIITNIFNDADNYQWNVIAFDGMSGGIKLRITERYVSAITDLDGNGVYELLMNTTRGRRINTIGPLSLTTYDDNIISESEISKNAEYQWSTLASFPSHINSGAALQKQHPTLFNDWGGNTEVFVTRETKTEGETLLRFLTYDGESLVEIGSAEGPNLTVLGSLDPASGTALLRTTYEQGAMNKNLRLTNFDGEIIYSGRVQPGDGYAATARGLWWSSVVLPQKTGNSLIVSEMFGEKIRAFQFRDANPQPDTLWTIEGRGMVSQNIGVAPVNTTASVAGFTPFAEGDTHALVARRGAHGAAAIAAVRPDGTTLWEKEFAEKGAPPVWNNSGLTHWLGGNFRSTVTEDAYVISRRSNMHTEEARLLSGIDGSLVWSKTEGSKYASCYESGLPFIAGPNPNQPSLMDFDGDGLDDILDNSNFSFSIYQGLTGTKLLNKWSANWCRTARENRLFSPVLEGWTNTVTASIQKLTATSPKSILFGQNPNTMALMTSSAEVIWRTPERLAMPTYTQQIAADLDGDGILEIIVAGVCASPGSELQAFNSTDGSLRWSKADPDLCAWPPARHPSAADIDGDGRDEIILAASSKVWAVAEEQGAPTSRWTVNLGTNSTYGIPGSVVIASVNEHTPLQLLINTSKGYLISLGSLTESTVVEAD